MFTQPGRIATLWRDTTILETAVASLSAIARIIAVVSVGGFLLSRRR